MVAQTLTERTSELLAEAEHADAAGSLEQDMVQAAVANIRAHLEQQGDLRGKAIADGTIDS